MRSILLFSVLLMMTTQAFALRIYQTQTMGEANARIALVPDRTRADIAVHRVSSSGLAHGATLWYITRDRQEAEKLVFFTSVGMANCNVIFVDTYGESGILTPNGSRCFR